MDAGDLFFVILWLMCCQHGQSPEKPPIPAPGKLALPLTPFPVAPLWHLTGIRLCSPVGLAMWFDMPASGSPAASTR